MPSSDNGRVTLAIVKKDIEHLTAEVTRLRLEYKEGRQEDRRLWIEANAQLTLLSADLDAIGHRVTRNEERLKATTAALTGLQLVSASIAAAIGALFK